jgi:putative PIG3 family NAD(P)H quinone oxidoreductase
MIAIEITRPGAPDVLQPVERAVPEPRPGELLVRVAFAGVNRPDILQRLGQYPPPPGASDIPGLEIAGVVTASNAPGSRFAEGARVCALVAGGGYAEYCAVPDPQCLPIPDGVDEPHAAAIPETYFTVWTNLFDRAHLTRGESVLIHGGTSGIGTTAIQLARAFGVTVYATAGSEAKADACRRLGAARAINYRREDFVAVIRDETKGRGVDVILDIIGGDYLARNLESLAMEGRLVEIGTMGGAKGEINLTRLLQRRLTITGSTLRARSPEEKGVIARALEAQVWPLVSAGTVRPIVDAVLPLRDAAEAHRRLEAGAVVGKLVLAC